jgi:hypothetical protein
MVAHTHFESTQACVSVLPARDSLALHHLLMATSLALPKSQNEKNTSI